MKKKRYVVEIIRKMINQRAKIAKIAKTIEILLVRIEVYWQIKLLKTDELNHSN